MAYTKYSLTPASNNAAPPDGAPEGMLPSAVNDTMRDMMAQIRDCGDGIRGGTYTMTAPVITGGSVTGASGSFTTLAASSTVSGTGFSTYLASPPAIGGATAAAGKFTTLEATSTLTLPSQSIPFSALPTGSVLQVVQGTSSTNTNTTSTSYVTTNLSASITPKFSTSKILIIVNGTTYAGNIGTYGYYTIFRGTVAGTNLNSIGFNVIGASYSDLEAPAAMSYLDSPATTSATTYTVALRAVSGTVYWAANSALSTIILMEIAA
jgi:hypothetical protein